MTDQVVIGVEELLAQAQRLGLTPVYRLGTVLADPAATSTGVMVVLDNDTTASRCFNYGGSLHAGDRVLTVSVRPQGIYVLGQASTGEFNPRTSWINTPGVPDTTTSATYVNLAAPSSVSVTKLRNDTRIEVDLRLSCFLTVIGNTEPSFAVLLNGVATEIISMLINPVSTHIPFSAKDFYSVPAGTYTIQIQWRRVSGTGTLSRGTDDWISLSARETFV